MSEIYKNKDDIHQIEGLLFEMDNMMSLENMVDPDKVKKLQLYLNKYVLGAPQLDEDGIVGNDTINAIRQYQRNRHHWTGITSKEVNPLIMEQHYQANKENNYKSKEGVKNKLYKEAASKNIQRDLRFNSNPITDINEDPLINRELKEAPMQRSGRELKETPTQRSGRELKEIPTQK
tara:strand:+ start:509 stop:1039 length:531 start_codon:yes stop_codon:yes gene_type:complete